MSVTVVIPSFNHALFLPDAIRSVLQQTRDDWECVVVDDGSTDETRDVMESFVRLDKRIRYVWQENRGLAAARNAGVAAATGEWIQFLDADDLLGSRKLAFQLDSLATDATVDIAYVDWYYFRNVQIPGGTARSWAPAPALPRVSGSGYAALEALLPRNPMVVESPLVKRSVLHDVGGFDESLPRLEDWDCWVRCAMVGARFFYQGPSDRSVMPAVRINPSSMSSDRVRMLQTSLELRKKFHARVGSPGLRRLNRAAMHREWAEIGILKGLGEDPSGGRHWLLRAGVADRRWKWLLWGLLMPALRTHIGRRVIDHWSRWSTDGSMFGLPETLLKGRKEWM